MALLRLYLALAGAGLRSQLQYRTNCIVLVLMGLTWQGTNFVFIWVILSQFHNLAGWTLGEIAFLYGLRLIAHSFSMLIFGVFQRMEPLVRLGEFDLFLVRPVPPFIQVITYHHFAFSAFGDLLGGILVFVIANTQLSINWSPFAVIYLLLAIVGGCLVETAIKLAASSLAFRTHSVYALVSFFDDILNLAGSYPLVIYGNLLRLLFTFVLPIAFVAYLPTTIFLNRLNELSISPIFAFLSPFVGGILFVLAYLFFEYELRYYQSSGH